MEMILVRRVRGGDEGMKGKGLGLGLPRDKDKKWGRGQGVVLMRESSVFQSLENDGR